MYIPILIDPEEPLVRFIFEDNFKKRIIENEKIIPGNIFLDTRNVGVSLQRLKYSSRELCRQYAKNISSKEYVGIVSFLKHQYDECVIEYQREREQFETKLDYTPLDENNNYLIDIYHCSIEDNGNPSHSDLFYINPALTEEERESGRPHTSLRLFSNKLFRKCEIHIDLD
jgi:hypothetical protein